MELQTAIVAVNQEMNLETGITATYLVLRLGNGEHLRALIDEESVSVVVALSVEQNGLPRAAAAPAKHRIVSPPRAPESMPHLRVEEHEGTTVHVFGGDDSDDDMVHTSAPLLPPDSPPPAPTPTVSRVLTLANGKRVVPSITLPPSNVDTLGNPIPRNNGGVDPGLSRGPGADEDGIASA